MGFQLYILGMLAVGGLLAWNVYRVSSESNNDESTNAVRYLAFDGTPCMLIPGNSFR